MSRVKAKQESLKALKQYRNTKGRAAKEIAKQKYMSAHAKYANACKKKSARFERETNELEVLTKKINGVEVVIIGNFVVADFPKSKSKEAALDAKISALMDFESLETIKAF